MAAVGGGGGPLENGGDQAPVDGGDHEVFLSPAERYDVVFPLLLSLQREDLLRCCAVSKLWREVIRGQVFRRAHHFHGSRTPMPIVISSGLPRVEIRALDTVNHAFRPLLRLPPQHLQGLQIHGSTAGMLLLSFGQNLYVCNPFTRQWAHLQPLHTENCIVGFYSADRGPHADFRVEILYHNRRQQGVEYFVYRLDTADARSVDPPGNDIISPLLSRGIAPSYVTPPVQVMGFIYWLPQVTCTNTDVLRFNTESHIFSLIPPPRIIVDGEPVPLGVGAQLFRVQGQLSLGVIISAGRVEIWVKSNISNEWRHEYHIRLPLYRIRLNAGFYLNGVLSASVLAVSERQNCLVLCPHILLQVAPVPPLIHTYNFGEQWAVLSPHTIQESLLLQDNILPMRETDSPGEPPFFFDQEQVNV